MPRLTLSLTTVLLAVVLLSFCVRTGVASWLVEPTPYPAPAPTVDSIVAIQRASALAPGEVRYPFFEAMLLRRSMRASWLSPEATELGQRASASVDRALGLVSTNPYFHRLAASIALERSRLPGTPDAERRILVDQGVASFRTALALNQLSPRIQQLAGTELLGSWNLLDSDGRDFALECLRQAGVSGGLYQVSTLSTVWNNVPKGEVVSALQRVVADSPAGHRRTGRFVAERAAERGIDPALAVSLRRLALAEHAAATVAADFDLAYLEEWIETQARMEPQDRSEILLRLEALADEHPNATELRIGIARVRELSEDRVGAMRAADEAVELSAEDSPTVRAAAHAERATLLRRSGDLAGVLADLDAAIIAMPQDAELHIQRARTLAQLGREDEALTAYEDAVRIQPTGRARRALARAYSNRYRYLDAIEQWQALLAVAPESIMPNVELGRLYQTLGDTARAAEAYERALELDPGNRAARQGLNELLRTGR